ncbi:MAG: S1 RNA-binding domain-containing protein [Clostridia bacterium]|nr:S1 RNA-binding domain-containing protein [Clostridia bacterium]
MQQIEVGLVVEGKVTGIAAFGAFVELEGGKTGLVHISEIASEYVNDINQHLKEGQVVKVKVIGTDKGKISLSIKQTEAAGNALKKERRNHRSKRQETRFKQERDPKQPPEEFEFAHKRKEDMSFDDMLQKFKQDSDEKFQDLKRSNEVKRSGGYKRAY